MVILNVKKRSGELEPISLDKIHRVLEWACEGLTGVSISEIELRANIQLYDGILANDIHELLIKSASELISEETPNYQYVAARLINYNLRKIVYGDYEPPILRHIVEKNVNLGLYDPALLEIYTDEEWEKAQSYIKHHRDDNFAFAGMEQFRGKYLLQDRSTGDYFETPQVLYMLVAMTLFSGYDVDNNRIGWVKRYYDAISTFKISLPTPIMAGARTNTRQFSSCVLIESGDSLPSIFSTGTAIGTYAAKRAGIGVNGGAIRAVGSKVGQGEIVHTGVVPFWRYFRGALKSCSQGGIRGASATINYPFWHYEAEDLLVLKNNKGTFETRIRDMDYCIHLNGFFLERVLANGKITLFSPNDVPDLYQAFYDQNTIKFKNLYEKYERSRSIRKKSISAREYFSAILTERQETGRIYIFFADHVNTHSSFKVPIKMTNLCTEITLPTNPFQDINDENGEIALCTLSAINWGIINDPEDFKEVCTLAVRGLDALLSYQDYPIKAAKISTEKRRPLGVGIINFAYFLAKRGLKYDKEALATIHEYAEAWSYYLIEASIDLAEEQGACTASDETKYADGIFPIDTYKKSVDELVSPEYHMDWEALRDRARTSGVRNSTLMALMPSETSAQISNATNGIEPPPELVTKKKSKHGTLAQVVPEIQKLKNVYDLRWDQNVQDYLSVCAVLQKFMDQAGSFNTSHNPEHFEGNKIPMSQLMTDTLYAYKYGLKTLYYANPAPTKVEDASIPDDDGPIAEEEVCDSCTI